MVRDVRISYQFEIPLAFSHIFTILATLTDTDPLGPRQPFLSLVHFAGEKRGTQDLLALLQLRSRTGSIGWWMVGRCWKLGSSQNGLGVIISNDNIL